MLPVLIEGSRRVYPFTSHLFCCSIPLHISHRRIERNGLVAQTSSHHALFVTSKNRYGGGVHGLNALVAFVASIDIFG